SRRANDAIGWIAGILTFFNATYYRHFHAWHHRYTQDPERDPELIFPKAKNRREYLTELSGLTFWWRRILDYPRLALGLARDLPFHAEHHLYPAVPFHHLPALRAQVRDRLRYLAPGYRAANRDIVGSLRS